jgi:uncharacterized protein with NAD-binding domain and iron-sulfur cluster
MTDAPSKKHKIAILGGGMAALTAAFELTNRPGWKDRYELTVYQQGHRLGGKGASGRNRKNHDRIEEHGLHIWLGFYENAFRVIKDVYAELGRNPTMPNATFRDAFKPHDYVVLEEQVDDGWRHWEMPFPRNDAEPGSGGVLPTGWDFLVMLLRWMADSFEASPLSDKRYGTTHVVRTALDTLLGGPPSIEAVPSTVGGQTLIDHALSPFESLQRSIAGILGLGGFDADGPECIAPTSAKAFLPVAHELAKATPPEARHPRSNQGQSILKFIDHFANWLWEEVKSKITDDDESRRLFIALDYGAANVRGMIRDGIVFPPYDFRAIDRWDYKDWLRRHGASEITIQSAPVRALYDLVFSADDGMAAGVALYGALRGLFTYKGAVMWKMQGGMGDVIFAPLYTVLRRRGVKFEFFHRVRALSLSGDKHRVSTIEIGRQVTLKDGREYKPLFDVKGLPSWPSEPLYEQIVEGEELQARKVDLEAHWTDWEDEERIRLELGRDFDHVVFGISVSAVPHLCKELLEHSQPLADMVASTKTKATQAMQLWLTPTAQQLGWKGLPPIVGCYEKPFDTWADMSFLVDKESWKPPHVPGHIAYLCNLLEDEGEPTGEADTSFAPRQHARAVRNAVHWLTNSVHYLWPDATTRNDPEELNWDWLVDPEDGIGRERLENQYIRANVNPSDRYVLSVPGSTRYRLRAHQSGYHNFFLAGDWLLTSINGGCIEAAVMGGMQASRAISGYPKVIVGDLPPEVDEGMRPPLPPAPANHPPRPRPSLPPPPVSLPALPEYVSRGGDVVLRPPFEQTGTRLYAFFFRARKEALVALCDRHLNIPARGAVTYRPFAPFVALVCADIEKIRSLDPRDARKGWLSEQDVGFWIPVMGGHMDGDRFVSTHAAWFLPYIFVDTPAAVVTGREIYGFPKQQAAIRIPRDARDFDGISVDAAVLARYAPEELATERRILDVRRLDTPPGSPLGRVWRSLERAGQDLRASLELLLFDIDPAPGVTLPGRALLKDVLHESLRERVRMVFLKQFRDAGLGNRACYQSIVEAVSTVRTMRDGGPLAGHFAIALRSYASHPIAEDLGLEGRDMGDHLTLHSVFAAWADFDFDVDVGTEVWRAR